MGSRKTRRSARQRKRRAREKDRKERRAAERTVSVMVRDDYGGWLQALDVYKIATNSFYGKRAISDHHVADTGVRDLAGISASGEKT